VHERAPLQNGLFVYDGVREIAVNSSGGLLAKGHSFSATSVSQIIGRSCD
jgi:acetyl-CoA acetyltransferase